MLYTDNMNTSRRELNKIKSRKRILKASRKLFSTKGYDETMMEDIAQSAEVSKATVYNYFPSKESLLIGTANEVLDLAILLAEKLQKEGIESEQIIREVLDAFVKASITYPYISRRITFLSCSEDSVLYHIFQNIFILIGDLIKKSQEEGSIRSDAEARELVDIIMGVMLITQFQWDNPEKLSEEERKSKLNKLYSSVMADFLIK